jgi:hypothetical protein
MEQLERLEQERLGQQVPMELQVQLVQPERME